MSRKAKSTQAREELESRIGYAFADKAILDRALTHISAASPKQGRGGSYQRLEFLGDHVLGLAVSDMLYRAFPKADEGELSRRLANSESNSGGRRRTAILADVCEALIGAVFTDGGYPAAAAMIERLWQERMLKPARPLRDPKTMLQEWAQGRGLPTPSYREVERTGPHHNPIFRVAVDVADRQPAEGVGRSKRVAEQAAAAALLTREGVVVDV